MSEVLNNQNLNSHYSTNAKVHRPSRPIANAPQSFTKPHLFDDNDANNRLKAINQDIYNASKNEEKRPLKNFLKIFGTIVAGIIAYIGIKKLFK